MWERNPLCFAAGGGEAAELGGRSLSRERQPAKLSSTGTAKLPDAEVQGKFVQSISCKGSMVPTRWPARRKENLRAVHQDTPTAHGRAVWLAGLEWVHLPGVI